MNLSVKKLYPPVFTPFILPGYTISVERCSGNKTTRTVRLEFAVYHQLPQQLVIILADNTLGQVGGQTVTAVRRQIGAIAGGTGLVPTQTSTLCYVEFSEINPAAFALDQVVIALRSYEAQNRNVKSAGQILANGLLIDWK